MLKAFNETPSTLRKHYQIVFERFLRLLSSIGTSTIFFQTLYKRRDLPSGWPSIPASLAG